MEFVDFEREHLVFPVNRGKPESIQAISADRTSILERVKSGQRVGLQGAWAELLLLQQDMKTELRDVLPLLCVGVRDGVVAAGRAPKVGWFGPEWMDVRSEQWFSLSTVLGLNGSWQWYLRGLPVPGLPFKLRPLHGVYFLTRFEHVVLFQNWLKRTPLQGAILEIGTGSGVLTASIMRFSEAMVTATDISPNAVASLFLERKRHGWENRLSILQTDLDLGLPAAAFDAVVFNPPWLAQDPESVLEHATRRPVDLLDRFFAGAHRVLKPGGKLLMLYSNLGRLQGLEAKNPVLLEIEKNKRFQLHHRAESAVTLPRSSPAKEKLRRQRLLEKVELWELRRAAN